MIYLLLIICSPGWFVAWYFWRVIETGDPKRWRTELPPEDADRGPNADDSYRAVTLGGHSYWFTREEVARAHERALKYSR